MSSIRERLFSKNSKYYKKVYDEEKEKQSNIRTNLSKYMSDKGVMVNTNNFGTTRTSLPIQERSENVQNKQFSVNNNSLQRNVELEQKYQNIKKSDEYKEKENELIEQSNKVGYAKYNYDQELVNEDNIGLYDKTLGTIFEGAKSVFDYSGGLVKNENGDFMYLPNKTELKQQKVQDSYDTGVGKFLGTAGYEIGKIAGTTAINQVLPGVSSGLYFGKMYVDSTNNAIRDGYDTSSATLYGLVSVASEYITGKFLGSATKKLTGGKTNAYTTLLNDTFNKMLKKPMLSKVLANAGSEATEEFIQEFLDNVTKLAVLDKSTNLGDYVSIFNPDTFADALYSAGVGAISGGVLGSVQDITNNSNSNNIYQTYKNQLLETKKNTTNKEEIERIDGIIAEIDKIQENGIQSNENISTVQDIVNNENRANSNYSMSENNIGFPIKNYQYVKSDNIKIDNLRKSASQYFDSSKGSVNFINTIEKLIEEKGYNIVFDDTITTFDGKVANGQVTTENGETTIKLNPKSGRAGEFLLVHEITHVIENDTLRNLVLDYASKKPGYASAIESLKATYGTNDVSSEVVADISGQLLGNQEFINSLSLEQPSIFRRIYNKIIELANKITGNSNEALFIRDLKNKWEEAYRTTILGQSVNNINNTIFYSINPNFATEYDNWNKKSRNGNFVIGKTSEALKSIGLDERNIVIDKSKILSIKNKHPEMTDDFIKQIPNILENPTIILKSQSVNGRLVIFGDIITTNGRPILVAMELNPAENNANVDKIYKVASAYGRQNVRHIQNWLNNPDNILYIDKQKNRTINWLNGLGLQLPVPSTNNGSSVNNIPQSNQNVKSDTLSTKYSMQESNTNTDIIDDIREFQKGTNSFVESFKGDYFTEMLKTAGIKVPSSFNYVSDIRPDFSFTTTKNLTRQQYNAISNAMIKLKEFDTNSITQNNIKYSLDENTNITDDQIREIINNQINYYEDDGYVDSSSSRYEDMLSDIFSEVEKIKKSELSDEDSENILYLMGEFYDSELEGYVSKEIHIRQDDQYNELIEKIDNSSDYIKNHNYISNLKSDYKYNISNKNEIVNNIEDTFKELTIIDGFISKLSSLTEIDYIDTSSKSTSTYIDIEKQSLNNKDVVNLLEENGANPNDMQKIIDDEHIDDTDTIKIRIANHDVGGRFDMNSQSFIDYDSGDIELKIYYLKNYNNKENVELSSTKYSMQENQSDTVDSQEIPLSQRVSGDKLLDTLDFIDEIKSVGAEVDDNGYVTVYHQTTDENAQKIMQTGEMISRELDIFFSTSSNAQQSDGRGTTKLEFKIPAEKLILDDIFDDNADVKISLNGQNKLDVSDYLVTRSQYSQNNLTWQEHLEKNYKATGTRTNMRDILLPTREDIQRIEYSDINLPLPNKTSNPLEIANLTPNNANTTPDLPVVKRNQVNDGDSRFAENIRNKTNMLTEEQKNAILSDEEVRYYDKITNEESLNKAFEKLQKNGADETVNWFSKKSEEANATDVAEGWILLKQYADNGNSDGMVAVAKKLRDIGTKSGQTVQAFNIMARMTPEGMIKYAQTELMDAYDNMVKGKTKEWIDKHKSDFDLTPQETGAILDIMKKVSTMEDGYDKRVELAKIQKIMTDKLPPSRGAGIKSWMRISMLFNPKTQIRNVAGNAVIAPVNYFSDLFASIADKMVGSKTGYRTTGITDIPNYVKGFKKGAYQSYNDFRLGINTRNIKGNRFEITEGKSFNNNTRIGKTLNRVDSLLSFMLDAGDRTFYEASFTNSINNQLVLNNTTEVTQEMIDIATQEALSRTWQDNNNYTKFVLSVRNGLNKINVKGYGLGDVLIPFAKTPANLTKAIVDYSPAGLVNTLVKGKNLKNAIETGQFTPQMQHDFVQSLGKATAGTMLYVLGYALAKAGITSGESDDDKDVQNFMKNTLGVNSYSIKIGDKSFTYDWAQPLAAPLSIMANIVQKENENASTLETVLSSLDTAGNILLEQSFMESINTALNNTSGLATGVQEAIFDLPARAIPTFMKQIADMIDGTQRTSFEYGKPLESAINSVKSKIPFLSKTLAPSVDSMGREIQKYGGKNNIFNVFLNPANVSTENISISAKEIYRLYKSTGETNIMPRVAPYYINQDGNKITLSSEQRAKYQKISGDIIEDNVKKLLQNSQYNELSDKEKTEVISDIVNYSYNIAQKEVLDIELSETYKKAYEYSQIGDISDYYNFKANIDDTDKDTKRDSISNYLLNSDLDNVELAFLYGSYYSSEEILNNLVKADIPLKEFIKYDSQEFTSDYYTNGKTIPNSRKYKVINYINSLSLSIPQKAILIKMEYNSFDAYDTQIVNYINDFDYSEFDKASMLKLIGFDFYDKYLVNYINSQNLSIDEKEEKLKDLGFTIRNGVVYFK